MERTDRQAELELRQFAVWLRTGRLSNQALGDGAAGPEFKFNPWHDPADGRFTQANSGRYFGPGGNPASAPPARSGRTTPPPQPGTNGGYDGPEIVVEAPRRSSNGARRIWPVAGNGVPAQKGARGSNGHSYADGRFSREGRYRIDARTGQPRKHLGIDLPGEPGDPVVSAADGTVRHIRSAQKSGDFGNSVTILHPDGTTTGYAHLQKITVI